MVRRLTFSVFLFGSLLPTLGASQAVPASSLGPPDTLVVLQVATDGHGGERFLVRAAQGPEGYYAVASISAGVVGTVLVDAEGRATPSLIPSEGLGVSYPSGIGWVADTLWVKDALGGVARATWDLARLDPVQFTYRLRDRVHLEVRPDAMLADGGVLVIPSVSAEWIARGAVTEVPILRAGRDGSLFAEIGTLSIERRVLRLSHRDRVRYLPQPFNDDDLFALAPDGTVIVVIQRSHRSESPSGPRITAHTPTGDTLYTRALERVERAVTSDDISRAVARLLAEFGLEGDPIAARIEERMYIPSHHPVFVDAVISRDHWLWLRSSHDENGDQRWLVLDASGDIGHEVLVPAGFHVVAVEQHAVVGWTAGAEQVALVRRPVVPP